MSTTLVPCRPIGGLLLKRNDTFRTLLIENEIVAFTPIEYRLLLALLDGNVVEDKNLTKTAFSTNLSDRAARKNLERHIENIKSKLKPTGLYVRRAHMFGYTLVSLRA